MITIKPAFILPGELYQAGNKEYLLWRTSPITPLIVENETFIVDNCISLNHNNVTIFEA